MSNKSSIKKPQLLAVSAAALLGTTALTAIWALPAAAQDDQSQAPVVEQRTQTSEAAVPEITITGSRIVRRDYTASSPFVTVDSAKLERISNIGIENVLNKLPQFVPGGAGGGPGSGTQFGTGDVQGTAFNTPGISTVNLRGIGTFRNLVLIDGRRAQPANAGLTVDVNTIPSAAIDSVEIITGGASAVYGADAVSGVVNFKLKHDYEGVSFDAQTGISQHGDGEETRISGLIGGNFAGGRGNVIFGGEWSKRGSIAQADRKFYRGIWADPGNNGTEFFPTANYYAPLNFETFAFDFIPQANIDALFPQVPAGSIDASGNFYVNKDGSIYISGQLAHGAFPTLPAIGYTGPLDGLHYKLNNDGQLQENATYLLASSPLERYSTFGRARYEITPDINFFLQGNFSDVQVNQILVYSPAVQLWGATIPRDAQHPVPAGLAALLDARADPTAPWFLNRAMDFIGPRRSENSTEVYQIMAGFDGNIPVGDWTYEVFGSHGKTTVINQLYGFASTQRWRTLVAAPFYGEGFDLAGPPNTGTSIHCTTGLPIFDDFTPSQDCLDAISANMKNTTTLKQDIVEANLQGGIVDLPAGQVRGALGASYRKNSARFEPDLLNDAESVIEQPVGLFAANNTAGSTNVKEIYGELLVPVLDDVPAIQHLELELGARFSDYNASGTKFTYKALGHWDVTNTVSFRGGFQQANRAPNVAELFTGPSQLVVGFPFSDPCTNGQGGTTAPWGNIPSNPDQAQVQALCGAISGLGAAAFVNFPAQFGFFPLEIEVRQGTPVLDTEKAKTITFGGVLRSPAESGVFSDITATVDFYQIKINNAIRSVDAVSAYQACFNGFGTNPTYDPNYFYCTLIGRSVVNGARQQVLAPYLNLGKLITRGLDMSFNWLFDIGNAGQLNLNVQANYLFTFKTNPIPEAPLVENAGTLAQDGQFRYKTTTNLTYIHNEWQVGLQWRHLPSIKDESYATNHNTTVLGVGSYDIFDLYGNWAIKDNVSLRAGMDNVLNKQPPRTGVNPGVTNGVMTSPGYYDTIGRRFYGGVSINF